MNLRVGHSFGEMALVKDRPRNASVRVTSKLLTCMALSKMDFQSSLVSDSLMKDKLVESTEHLEVVRKIRSQMLRETSHYNIINSLLNVETNEEENEEGDEYNTETRSPSPLQPRLEKASSVQKFKLRSESYVEMIPTQRSPRRRVGSTKTVNEYQILKRLGSGSFADVKLVQHVDTKKNYAMKCLKGQRRKSFTSSHETDDLEDIMLEIKIMKLLDHINIVKLEEVIKDEKYIYIIQELCDGGSIMPDAENPKGATKLSNKRARMYVG